MKLASDFSVCVDGAVGASSASPIPDKCRSHHQKFSVVFSATSVDIVEGS